VNEMMPMLCASHGYQTWWKWIDAAGDQAVRLHAFLPRGPGWAGTAFRSIRFICSWKTKQAGIEARFIELAGYINAYDAALWWTINFPERRRDSRIAKPRAAAHYLMGVALHARDIAYRI